MNNLKTEIQRLRSRIVSNPEKLKQAIRDMNESLKQDKQTAAAAERKTRTLQSKIDMMNRVEQDIASCIVLLNEAQGAKEQHQANTDKLTTERDALERKEAQLAELGVTEQVRC
jgi:DNA repair ATPase RecN